MGTDCAPLLADPFLYWYETVFVQGLMKTDQNALPNNSISSADTKMMYCLNNSEFSMYLEFVYPHELEIKETAKRISSSSYLDLYLYIDNGKRIIRLYDKWDDFSFPIDNFPFLSSNIPSEPAYGVYVLRLTHYARACSEY